MTTKIELRRMTFYAYHGVAPQETRVGNTFIVDLILTAPLENAARATYGEEARDGVILVTLRKSGKEATGAAADSLAGAHTWIESSSDGTTRRITLSGSPSTLSGSTSASEPFPC